MIVLLTGGSRGIGKGIKEIFENQNYTVISPSKLEMDLSDIESVKSYLNTIKDLLCYLLLLYCIYTPTPFLKIY